MFTIELAVKKANILYLKSSWAFKHSNPLKGSPGSHSQLASDSVDIMSSCSLLTFSLSVSLGRCVYIASASQYLKLVTVLDYS